MIAILFDVAVVAVLLFFLWRGAKRGLVLTVCGLIAVLVALIGASILSNLLAEPLANVVEPAVEKSIQATFADHGDPGLSPDALPLDALVDALEDSPLLSGLARSFQDAVQQGATQVVTNAARSVAHYAAVQISHSILFVLGFFLLLILWSILSHALDLVTRLPVLHTLNELGGAAAGLLKGFLILCLVGFALRFSSWPPPAVVEDTHLLRFFLTDNPIARVIGL